MGEYGASYFHVIGNMLAFIAIFDHLISIQYCLIYCLILASIVNLYLTTFFFCLRIAIVKFRTQYHLCDDHFWSLFYALSTSFPLFLLCFSFAFVFSSSTFCSPSTSNIVISFWVFFWACVWDCRIHVIFLQHTESEEENHFSNQFDIWSCGEHMSIWTQVART